MRSIVWIAGVALLLGCGGDGGGGVTEPPEAGTLQGQVTGPGGGIPSARVAVSGGGSVQTNSSGSFTVADLQPGQRTVSVTPPTGFRLADGESASKSVNVTNGGTATVSWSMVLTDTQARTVEVGLSSNQFTSADVTIPVGSTVNWVNQTAITHTISPNDEDQQGTWEEQTISGEGTEFDHTFTAAGTYDYVCKLHSGMNGVVRVH